MAKPRAKKTPKKKAAPILERIEVVKVEPMANPHRIEWGACAPTSSFTPNGSIITCKVLG